MFSDISILSWTVMGKECVCILKHSNIRNFKEMHIFFCVRMRERKRAQVLHHTSDVASQITQIHRERYTVRICNWSIDLTSSLPSCMRTRFQRCFGSQPSIIQQASGLGFIRSIALSCESRLLHLGAGTMNIQRFRIPWLKFFVGKSWIFTKKSQTLLFSIVQIG